MDGRDTTLDRIAQPVDHRCLVGVDVVVAVDLDGDGEGARASLVEEEGR